MFLETSIHSTQRRGWIEVICGSMFSGKTEELIRRLNRARIARQRVEIFKPKIDTRYDEVNVVSHNENSILSTPVDSATQILLLTNEVDVVGIDEVQFFDDEIVEVCNKLAAQGIRVIVAGLDMEFYGQSLWPCACLNGHSRICDKSSRHLYQVRQPGTILIQENTGTKTCNARRD